MINRRSEAGQALALVALGIVGLLAAAGLAVDMGYLRYEKRLMQTAADSAALAAANDANPGALYGASGDAITDAYAVALANGFQNDASTTVNVTADGGISPGTAVQVQITKTLPTFFMQIVGLTTSTISATGVATLGTSPGCIYALQNGLTVTGVNGISAPNCDVVVNGPLTGAGTLSAASVGVFPGPGDDNTGPTTPVSIAQPPQDPLAYVNQNPPTPSGTCAAVAMPITTTPATPLLPGTYCGGITITGGTVTFSPGLYILTGPADVGLQISGTGSAQVQLPGGVTFYLADTAGSFTFNSTGTITLIASEPAQVDGRYGSVPAGVLIYQNPMNSNLADVSNFSNAGTETLTGILYFPGAGVIVAGPSMPGGNTPVVAQGIQVVGGIAVNADTTSTAAFPGGSPLQNVSLVE
jgi:Flp pilus assembly protein TadG